MNALAQIAQQEKALNAQLREIGIFHNTNDFRATERFASYLRRDDVEGNMQHALRQAEYGFKWALATGRLSGDKEMALRALSPYERFRIIVDCAVHKCTEADVCAYLRGEPMKRANQ